MPRIELSLYIAAPLERVFDLSRSIDFHVAAAAATRERAVAGVTSGLIGPGQEVTWSARHLGVRQRLTVGITAYQRPSGFTDSMRSGAFATLTHQHRFTSAGAGTCMQDILDFRSPWGALGRLADVLVVGRHLRCYLHARGLALKAACESGEYRRYLPC